MVQLEKLIEPLKAISIQAGGAIMDIYLADTAEVQIKSDQSPVTSADLAANAIICEALEALTPHIPIISEETASVDYAIRSQYDYYWLVDPLDGTKEFIKRNGEFTVNIALIKGQTPILGFVYVPVTGDLYYGGDGVGAYLDDKSGNTTSLGVRKVTMTQPGLRVVTSRSHMSADTQAWIDKLDNAHIERRGSSLKMINIATGASDLYPKIGPTMEWDTGAADAILRAAGGSITKMTDGLPLEYNKRDLTNPHFLAAAEIL